MFGFRHITDDKKKSGRIYKPNYILVLFRSTKFTRQFRQLFLFAMSVKILAHQVKIAVDFYIYGKSQTAALNLNIQIALNSNGYTVNNNSNNIWHLHSLSILYIQYYTRCKCQILLLLGVTIARKVLPEGRNGVLICY